MFPPTCGFMECVNFCSIVDAVVVLVEFVDTIIIMLVTFSIKGEILIFQVDFMLVVVLLVLLVLLVPEKLN